MLKVILDANVIISALIFKCKMKLILDLAQKNRFEVIVCDELEYEVLSKFLKKFDADQETVFILADFFMSCKSVKISKSSKIKIRDQKDAYLLDLCISTKVDYLVTGDKDLLVLPKNSLKQTKIVSPKEFLDLVGFGI